MVQTYERNVPNYRPANKAANTEVLGAIKI